MIWAIFAFLAAAVLALLLLPVVRAATMSAADRNAHERAVFRDQLAELDRDVERGMIGESEADAARNEIARRLLAASAQPVTSPTAGGTVVALATALAVPVVAVPLYVLSGSPHLPDVPRDQRIRDAVQTGDFEALIVQVEEHLAKNPDDVKGWEVLAPAYRRMQRWSDAAEAQRNILRLSQRTAEALADYGEDLVLASNGLVTAEAHRVFTEALAMDAKLPKARFFDALALKQEGRTAEAQAAFEAFLADTPADAPWRPMLLAEMKGMGLATGEAPPGPDAADMAAAASMSPEERQAMIRSMVDGLERRLAADGSDLEGWLRLIRARSVLGETDRAGQAYAEARSRFKDDPRALARLEGLAREFNIP